MKKEVYKRAMRLLLRDRRQYYGDFFGSDFAPALLIKNFLRPQRLWKRWRFGQLGYLPTSLRQCEPLHVHLATPEVRTAVERIREAGFVVLDGFFTERAERICRDLGLEADRFEMAAHLHRYYSDHEDVLAIMVDEFLLSVVGRYYDCQPYHMEMAGVNVTYPSVGVDDVRAQFPCKWHYDMANQITVHVLMSDVSKETTRMRVAVGSHRRMHQYVVPDFDYNYSDEHVESRYEVVDCIGPKGTLIIIDPNTIHRAQLVQGTFRSHLHMNFSPGNDLIPRSRAESKGITGGGSGSLWEERSAKMTSLQSAAVEHLRTSW